MYNYLYDGVTHTDTSTDYLKKLGMDEEGIESLQRDAAGYEAQQASDFIAQRNDYLNDSDWMMLRHNDQIQLSMTTNMTEDEFKGLLTWRQELRDMSETAKTSTQNIVWPPLPDYLEDEFPDYPN